MLGQYPRLALAAAIALALTGCSKDVKPHLAGPFPKKLSAWRLFIGTASDLKPNRGVVPYDLNTTLFSDYATKHRYVWMAAGSAAVYSANDTLEFPKGTILIKTFGYPDAAIGGKERMLETRLLVNTGEGWFALPYVWNAAQTDAVLDMNADAVEVNWAKPGGGRYDIHYTIPNANQCRECHDRNKVSGPIGPAARRLNRDFDYPEGRANQLAYWTRIGYLKGAPDPRQAPRQPAWDDPASGSLEQRARAYLDVNCGHCHRRDGAASNTGLYLSDLETDPTRLGFCKTPVATGKASPTCCSIPSAAVRSFPSCCIGWHRKNRKS